MLQFPLLTQLRVARTQIARKLTSLPLVSVPSSDNYWFFYQRSVVTVSPVTLSVEKASQCCSSSNAVSCPLDSCCEKWDFFSLLCSGTIMQQSSVKSLIHFCLILRREAQEDDAPVPPPQHTHIPTHRRAVTHTRIHTHC